MTTEEPVTKLLHDPARASAMLPLADHIGAAAGLARLCWLVVSEAGVSDERDRAALQVALSILADHASAADALASRSETALARLGL